MPNCDACFGEKTEDCPDDCLNSHVRYEDAYWNAKDEFEHDIKELFGQFISPEEFEKKWRPRLNSEFEEWRKEQIEICKEFEPFLLDGLDNSEFKENEDK